MRLRMGAGDLNAPLSCSRRLRRNDSMEELISQPFMPPQAA